MKIKRILAIILALMISASFIVSADEVESKDVTFTYSENFDTMADGTLPEGWIVVNEDGREAYAKAEVQDKALYLYSRQQYNLSTYVLFDYAKVLRPGLTMECDITRLAVSGGNSNNSHAGLMYAVDYDSTTNTVKNASYVAPYIAKAEASSAVALRDFKAVGADANNAVCDVVGYADAEGTALQFNWATREKPVHLKIVLNNDTQSPVIYIDGEQLKYSRKWNDTNSRNGMIGLYAFNSTVSIDNIVISGTQTVSGTVTYDAGFKNSATSFVSIADAEANVVLTKTFLGEVADITADAEISTVLATENSYVTTVKYDKDADGTYEYEKALSWTLVYYDEGFAYTENFDTMADGTLPEGWTVVNEDSRPEYATVEVRDNALYLYSRQQYTKGVYVLFDYEKVLRPGLTMECDITRLAVSGGNSNNSHTGLMYAVDYDAETNTVKNASYVAPYIAKAEASSAIAVRDFKTDADLSVCNGVAYTDADGNALQFNWATREKPVHLKIVCNNDTQSPVIYIDGVQSKYSRSYSDSDSRILSGMIGFYVFNSTVSVDNIKISGTQRKAEATEDNKIEVLSYKAADGSVEALVQLNKTDLAAKTVFMAVYDKETKELVKLSELNAWAGAAKDYRTSVKVEGIDDFSADKYDVSVFAWNMNSLVPLCTAAGLN